MVYQGACSAGPANGTPATVEGSIDLEDDAVSSAISEAAVFLLLPWSGFCLI